MQANTNLMTLTHRNSAWQVKLKRKLKKFFPNNKVSFKNKDKGIHKNL